MSALYIMYQIQLLFQLNPPLDIILKLLIYIFYFGIDLLIKYLHLFFYYFMPKVDIFRSYNFLRCVLFYLYFCLGGLAWLSFETKVIKFFAFHTDILLEIQRLITIMFY
jgi:hypothetical protein